MKCRTAVFAMVCLACVFAAGCESLSRVRLGRRFDPWGNMVEGLQCRLQADKRTWTTAERPSFKLDIRNGGKRTYVFWPAHKEQLCRVEFDGRWYQQPGPVAIDSQVWSLSPGAQYNGLEITLRDGYGIAIKRGKHIVRVGLSLEGVQVVSNPAGIEIVKDK